MAEQPLKTTVGRLMANRALPPALRDYSRVLDAKSIAALMDRVAREHPDQYPEVIRSLMDLGRENALRSGGYGFGLEDLGPSPAGEAIKQKLRALSYSSYSNARLSPEQKDEAIVSALRDAQQSTEKSVLAEGLASDNPAALQVMSGSRGKPRNFKAMKVGDFLYEDHRGDSIPIPVLRSFSAGLSPAEHFASTFGARKGLVDVKLGTAKAGFFGKLLSQAAHRLVVTGRDAEDDSAHGRGLPVDASDPDNEGALLAAPAGGYPRNTVLTMKVLRDIQAKGTKRMLVRSPISSNPPEGGLYARDVGIRESGRLPSIGEASGIGSSQALAEPVAQGSLGSKHSGGVAGASRLSGLQYLTQLVQAPKASPHWAAHSQLDGVVGTISAAPAGGFHVDVAGQSHYVPAGATPSVASGDDVEAGDRLSDGVPNPMELIRHKGIGEGRRQYTEAFRSAMQDADMPVHRRNVETEARGLINRIRLTEEVGDHLPGDVIPYDTFETKYLPREGHEETRPISAVGRYLEKPVLHYTLGTRITPRVAKELSEFNVPKVLVHKDPPPFEPTFVRGQDFLADDPDWMTRMLGSNLERGFLKATHTGAVSDELGTSYVPSLAKAVGFGQPGNKLVNPKPGGLIP